MSQLVSDSDDHRLFAGCRHGGSQWACPEIACAPRFHRKLPQYLSCAHNHLSIIIFIIFVYCLMIRDCRLVLFCKDSTPPLHCPPPSVFDIQRKDLLWLGIAINMRAYNQNASLLCSWLILKCHRHNISWHRSAVPSPALALFLAKFHARQMHA